MKLSKMNRKGQFYILMAVILVTVIFALSYPVLKLTKPRIDVRQITDNYMTESKYVVDSALIAGKDIDAQLSNFTAEYLEFAQSKEPLLRMVSLLILPEDIVIKNYGAGKFIVYSQNPEDRFNDIEHGVLAPTDSQTIKRTAYVKLVKDDIEYDFQMPEEKYKVQALFLT